MIYFNSRYLSDRLEINAARWKRWSREFLQPDPLGGYQSGYARQFSYKDAFRVFFGGHLVGERKYSIPEARQILSDLDPWLKKRGFYELPGPKRQNNKKNNHIFIAKLPTGKFTYSVRTIVGRQFDGNRKIHQEHYELDPMGARSDCLAEANVMHADVILINALHQHFMEKIK